MGTTHRIVGLAIAMALVTVFLVPAASADMEKPTWTTGDFWRYTFTGLPFGGGGGGGLTPAGSLHIAVTGTDSVTVGGTTYETYRTTMAFNLNISSGGITITLTINGEGWYRTSDLGLTKQVLTIPDFMGSGQFSFTATYAPPQQMTWPLRAGATWTSTSLVTMTTVSQFGTTTDQATESTSFSVQTEASTTVPAGTFSAFPVRGNVVGEGYTISQWSASAGFYVRQQTFDDANQEQTSASLSSYKYQAAGGLAGGLLLPILLLLLVVVVAVVAGLAMRRRKRGAMVPYPPGTPQQPWQQQPPGGPPMQPPQQPGPPPPPPGVP